LILRAILHLVDAAITAESNNDVVNPGLIRPPFVYLISLVSGTVIHRVVRLSFLPKKLAVPLGVPLVAVAIALFSYSVAKFRAAGRSSRGVSASFVGLVLLRAMSRAKSLPRLDAGPFLS
jgi:hypothetical protein